MGWRRALSAATVALAAAAGASGTAGAAPAPQRQAPPATTRGQATVRATTSRGQATVPGLDPSPTWEATASGAVWDLGGAPDEGRLPPGRLPARDPVVAITVDPAGGYWLLSVDGSVFPFGAARFYGSPASTPTRVTDAAGLVPTADGGGYWIFTAGGRVLAYGDATTAAAVAGDPGSSAPAVALVATPDGQGYWLARADGTVAAYGDAPLLPGAPAGYHFRTVVGLAATPDGSGYWLLTAGGQVFASGDARRYGQVLSTTLGQPLQALVPTTDGLGYWLVAHDGDVYAFGDATAAAPPVLAFVHQDLTTGDRALDWAMAQLGKPYRWGGAGPGAFDCSGLTMMSWWAVGVGIPRVAADQFEADPHVPLSRLLAGDLVFWATRPTEAATIYHVAMYVGGGRIVQAPYPGQVVSTTWLGGTGLVAQAAAPET